MNSKAIAADFNTSLKAFFAWWGGELSALLPGALRKQLCPTSSLLILSAEEGSARMIRCEGGDQREIARYQIDFFAEEPPLELVTAVSQVDVTTIIQLAADDVLMPELTLPAEAESNLHEVLGYEMDRLTPFAAEQVYYDCKIEERMTDPKRIRVRSVVVAREPVDRLVEAARRWGFAPAMVTVSGDTMVDPNASYNLLPAATITRDRNGLGLSRLLVFTMGVLLVIAVALPLYQQQMTIQQLDKQINDLVRQSKDVIALQDKMDQLQQESIIPLERKRKSPVFIDVLKELSTVLPDHTWLQSLDLKENELTIQGQSSTASALIALLEESALFRDVTFQSPVVRDAETNLDQFQIVVRLNAPQQGVQ